MRRGVRAVFNSNFSLYLSGSVWWMAVSFANWFYSATDQMRTSAKASDLECMVHGFVETDRYVIF